MKQTVVFCTQPVRGKLYFYAASAGEEHYLFGQTFRVSLWNRYRFGVRLDDALDRGKCRCPAEQKVCEELFKSISYIKKEYGLSLLRKSRKSPRRTAPEREEDESAA